MHMQYVKIGMICLAVNASLARGFGGVMLQVISSGHVGTVPKCPKPSTEVFRPKVRSVVLVRDNAVHGQ